MNLYSSSSICGNCVKYMILITVFDSFKLLIGGKNFLNVDLF